MDTRLLLLEKYIKVAVKKALAEQEAKQKQAEKSMYMIYKFPGLKKTIEEVMSPAFGSFITNVSLIAPKPTTFKVKLVNDQDFTVKYLGKGKFSLKVAGKQYNPANVGERERVSQAISDLLELNYTVENKEGDIPETPAETAKNDDLRKTLENPEAPLPTAAALPPEPGGGGAEIPAPEETPPAEAPAATPPPPEETPTA